MGNFLARNRLVWGHPNPVTGIAQFAAKHAAGNIVVGFHEVGDTESRKEVKNYLKKICLALLTNGLRPPCISTPEDFGDRCVWILDDCYTLDHRRLVVAIIYFRWEHYTLTG